MSEYMEDARRHKTGEQKVANNMLNGQKQGSTSAPTRSRKGVLVYLAITYISWSPDMPATLLATDAHVISERYANGQTIL